MNYIKAFQLTRLVRFGNALHAIRCEQCHRCIRRWPEEFKTVEIRPQVFSCYEGVEAQKRLAKLDKNRHMLLYRVKRRIESIEKHNLAVARSNPQSLLELGEGCLKWYECLPIGISHQVASNLTRTSFFIEYWESTQIKFKQIKPQ